MESLMEVDKSEIIAFDFHTKEMLNVYGTNTA
jgi:hypothetical protein